MHTFSFASVSCLRAAAKVSFDSPLMTGGGPALKDALLAAAVPWAAADTRGDTAERAVAPLDIEEEGAGVGVWLAGDDRREVIGGGREAVVVMIHEKI